ncbi:ATP-binding protein, partial [Lysinibacillus sp. CNPSo 3705]|uniref:ATP-binding protein n=1 Tax=Lysinibacillus sp. CNPSo 3705 TaxID=3028148 RepID=UPI00236364FA
MNNKYGFILNRLVLSNSTETREIKLYKGLNFISGPTDTGKTYIYQLIKYLLGSNDLPKKIPENKNFNIAYLEIQSYSKNEIITLNRILGTNKINIYS